jgi:hypothetical protein
MPRGQAKKENEESRLRETAQAAFMEGLIFLFKSSTDWDGDGSEYEDVKVMIGLLVFD